MRELNNCCFKCEHYEDNYDFYVICDVPLNSETGYECPDVPILGCSICMKCPYYTFCKADYYRELKKNVDILDNIHVSGTE